MESGTIRDLGCGMLLRRCQGRAMWLFVCLVLTTVSGVAEEFRGIRVPEGFRVELYADDDLAHDIHSLTLDSRGRVVVSGPGYVRILLDRDSDGRADGYQQFADGPATGSQGMYFHGGTLLCAGDGGLLMFRDENGDDRADGPPQVFLKIAAGGEHHVHSIQRGPDGWWYVMAGNFSGVSSAYATAKTSPIAEPVSGALLRLTPALRGGEIVADGFRNAYDFAFTGAGDFFTYDSDDERDISLPWYLPTQVFQILPAGNAGYVSAGLKRPPTFADMPPVPAAFGRGSPTGVLCYRHRQFPEQYAGALFVQDWTLGRILCVPLQRRGAGWVSQPQEFAAGENQFGFAPTDMEVGPDGSLFVSVGGRGTRGSVYRISYVAGGRSSELGAGQQQVSGAFEALNRVLRAAQPNTAWSRAVWVPLVKELPVEAIRVAALDAGRSSADRMRAIEILVEQHGGLDRATGQALASVPDVEVRARTAWAAGRSRPESPEPGILNLLLQDRDAFVRRAALEAFATATDSRTLDSLATPLALLLGDSDRLVRLTAAQLLHRLSADQRAGVRSQIRDQRGLLWFYLGELQRGAGLSADAARLSVDVVSNSTNAMELRREAVRVLQLSLGDVGPVKDRPVMFDSYGPRQSLESVERDLNPLIPRLAAVFPSGDALLDRELIRVFAMVAPPNRDIFEKLLGQLTSESSPQDDIHCLIALSRLELERSYEESERCARALIGIDVKLKRLAMKQDTNWDDRMGELYAQLCRVDPALPSLLVQQPGFGLPGHVLYLGQVPAGVIPEAIKNVLATIAADAEYQWTSEIVFLIGESERAEHEQILRSQLDNLSVRDAVLMVLSEQPQQSDRQLYLAGLESTQLNTVEACLKALQTLPRNRDAAEQWALLACARRLIGDKREFRLRETVMRLLQNNNEQTLQFQFGESGYRTQPESMQAWQEWLERRYPDSRPTSLSEQAAAILKGLNEVPWDSGDVDRGRVLFERLGCAKCHGGRRSLGPDLTGVAKRFSRADLFASIVDPNRDISNRYQTTSIETTAGQVLTGLIVYESVDGLLLRDAEHRTYRVEATEIVGRHLQRSSLMPEGLLRNTVPQDLADLNSYLQGL
ncbi:MAG TPA: hypothetical protein DCR20_09700 [Planctomycetaceae bacterium]|nr:hypothetical protein [Planctomycetaceae bacterium]